MSLKYDEEYKLRLDLLVTMLFQLGYNSALPTPSAIQYSISGPLQKEHKS